MVANKLISLNSPIVPDFQKLTKYIKSVNDSGWFTNFGPLHQELTIRLEELLGVKNLLLVSNGTLAIQVACKALNVNRAITTPFSFAATASSLLWQNIETTFCDINPLTLNISRELLEKHFINDPSVDGIVATHVYGNPCDVSGVAELSGQYNKKIIYDAAHAFGIELNGKSILNYGDASTLSFHATKVFHTVEGGAIVFSKQEDYELARSLINFGIDKEGCLGLPGINAKLNEYQCAVGLTLLDDIEQIIDKRVSLYNHYKNLLGSVVSFQKLHDSTNLNGAYFPVIFEREEELESIGNVLLQNGVESRRYFHPSLDEVYEGNGSCHISRDVSRKILCLPLHYYMDERDVEKVVKVIKSCV